MHHYLERYDAPARHVRQLLMRRVHRAARVHDQDVEECAGWVDALLERLQSQGLIDDRRYAENTLRRLRERGQSARKIRASLAAKGVARELIDEVLKTDDDVDPERLAAIRYARRRRFGPWRRPDVADVDDKRRKELASMARAGFAYTLARGILDAEDAFALEDELPRGW